MQGVEGWHRRRYPPDRVSYVSERVRDVMSRALPVDPWRAAGAAGSVVVDRALDEPVLVREASGLGAVCHTELAVNLGEVELDGLLGHPQLLRDRVVRQASRESGENRGLAFGEAGGAGRSVACVWQI